MSVAAGIDVTAGTESAPRADARPAAEVTRGIEKMTITRALNEGLP